MTREEAIEILNEQGFHFDDREDAEQFCEAYNMATRSLEAWDKAWKCFLNHDDVWDISEILEVLEKHLKEVEE